nr:hypothetical protein BaRGS_000986 [Batillaria attramentaria]
MQSVGLVYSDGLLSTVHVLGHQNGPLSQGRQLTLQIGNGSRTPIRSNENVFNLQRKNTENKDYYCQSPPTDIRQAQPQKVVKPLKSLIKTGVIPQLALAVPIKATRAGRVPSLIRRDASL